MGRVPNWVRRVGKDLGAGLVAVGQFLGAYTPPECYGLGPVARTAADDGTPVPGHPERLVPVSEWSGPERATCRRLEDMWEREDPGTAISTPRSRRPKPHPRRG
ncbi:DUF6059 family protein [Streptomyces sp. NPDC059153]|uniref:DUF6059 family protein n=1 Tax=Streptomyces sp. NPDC059153 TaxID=3346743 RepID=UPI0036CCBAD4